MSDNNEHDRKVRVHYKFGDVEMDVEGPEDYVEQHAAMFLDRIRESNVLRKENYAPFPLISSTEENEEVFTNENVIPIDLLGFYEQKSPQTQQDQVLVITYFHKRYGNKESLTLEDYGEAYSALKRLAVKTPANLKSTVRNVVDRSPYLYNADRGEFALTRQGENRVESMNAENKE